MMLTNKARPPRRTFGTATTARPRLNLIQHRLEEELSEAHLRLARVMVENLSYADCIRRYDRPHTFFYIDPPYYNCEDDYGMGMFGKPDFGALADLLRGISGRFLLSLNDTLETRELFKDFLVGTADTSYSAGLAAPKKVTELLIRNY